MEGIRSNLSSYVLHTENAMSQTNSVHLQPGYGTTQDYNSCSDVAAVNDVDVGLSNVVSHDDVHECNQCSMIFCDTASHAEHVKTHTLVKRYPCTYCSRSFDFMANLKEHLRVHTGEKPFKCKECDSAFKRSSHLTRHIMQIHLREASLDLLHSDDSITDPSNPNKLSYVCSYCNKKFKRPNVLAAHERTHIGELDIDEQWLKSDSVQSSLNGGTVGENEQLVKHEKPTCTQCGQQFTLLSSLKRHWKKIHTGSEQPFKCRYCNHTFLQPDLAHKHELSHMGRLESFICGECNRKFATMSKLMAHMRIHNSDKPLMCYVCGNHFSYNSSLQHHLRSHGVIDTPGLVTNPDAVVKPEPVDVSYNEEKLATHDDVVTSDMQQVSSFIDSRVKHSAECNTTNDTIRTVIDNIKQEPKMSSHNETISFNEQLVTSDSYSNVMTKLIGLLNQAANPVMSSLNASITDMPSNTQDTQDNNVSSKVCLECGQKFTLLSSLRRHLKIHTGDKPYQCKHCPKSFPLSGYLREHERTHAVEKPFICVHCNKAFSKPRRLKYHMRIHTGEKPYSCKFCGKRFAQPSGLDVHIRTHTGDKNFKCGECGRRFSQSSNLITHMKQHSGEKHHECHSCGDKFIDIRALRHHMKTHNDNDTAAADNNENRTAAAVQNTL